MLSGKLLHLEHRLDQGQGRFSALVFIQAVNMQAIAAAAGGFIIHRDAQGIASEEPFKGLRGIVVPANVLCDPEGIQARRHQGIDLHRLLVEIRDLALLRVKALVTDGHDPSLIRLLDLHQPGQRLQPDRDRLRVIISLPVAQERLRQGRVTVRDDILEPRPLIGAVLPGRAPSAFAQGCFEYSAQPGLPGSA